MGEIVPFLKPQPDRLSRQEFKAIVVELMQAGRLRIQYHLYRDHPEREDIISPADIHRCLLMGTVQEGPFINLHGNHQATFMRVAAGQKLTVVAAIQWRDKVIVITAF